MKLMSALLISSVVFVGCFPNKFFYCDYKYERRDSIVYSNKCSRFFNPFNRLDDTVEIFSDSGTFAKTIITNRLSLKNGVGKLECFVMDTMKFLECDVVNNKINGICKRYYLPDCKDIVETGEFTKNKLNGEYKQFGANGTLIIHRIYKKGQIFHKHKLDL